MSDGQPSPPTSNDAGAGPIGVLLMAYGTPRAPEEIETYYTDIRRGRPPTPEQLADLIRRYEAIGGISPLAQRTESQRQALQDALDERAPARFRVGLGLKHADPKIEQGAAALIDDGCRRLVGLVLALYYPRCPSASTTTGDGRRLQRATFRTPPSSRGPPRVRSWSSSPRTSSVARRGAGGIEGVVHRPLLPERVVAMGDPYPAELRSTATQVAGRLGLAGRRLADRLAVRGPHPGAVARPRHPRRSPTSPHPVSPAW
ncbi:MAG: ferrochelatase [Ilumatobacteraceae bacterium]